jgi:hypothetical protein
MDFFAELQKLYESTPKAALYNVINENSPYGNFMNRCKNCYLVANAHHCEDVFYGRDVYWNKDCCDSDHIHKNELLYECLDSRNCYNSSYLQDCEECNDCNYCFDCRGCKNCFGCVGLRQKEFHIFNKPVPEEDYFGLVAQWKKKGHKAIWNEFEKLKETVPRLFARQIKVENVTGDYIKNSKEIYNSFGVTESQDIYQSFEVDKSNDCCDVSFTEYAELCYECFSSYKLKNANFCTICWESSDLEYCFSVFRSRHCFGSVFLNHKEYHILNKPYSKDDYFKKKAEIKDQLISEGTYGKWHFESSYPFQDSAAALPRL